MLNKPRSGLWKAETVPNQVIYTSITCSQISNIPYDLIFTTKFNDSSILITIISCDYLNLSNAYVGDVTITTQVIKYSKIFSKRISQSHCSIQIKLNYILRNVWRYQRESRNSKDTTHNAITKRQTLVNQIIHSKPKIEQHERRWQYVLRKGRQFLLHLYHTSCYSC